MKSRYYYLHLLHTFSAIVSPVVFFTDDVEVAKEIQSLRSHLPPTKTNIVLMGRSDMWAFKICPLVNATEVVRQIRDMFPYRVAGTYICTMHAKFEVVHIAARMNYFHTKYIAWQDVSIFKHLQFEIFRFNYTACLPEGFQHNAILYGQHGPFKNGSQPTARVGIWVRGGAFIGESNLMVITHCEDYKYHMMKYLTRGKPINWSLTDQVIIHAMAVDQEDPIRARIIGRRNKSIFICMERSDGVTLTY